MLAVIAFYTTPGFVIGLVVALILRFNQKKFLPAFLITSIGVILLQLAFVYFALGGMDSN